MRESAIEIQRENERTEIDKKETVHTAEDDVYMGASQAISTLTIKPRNFIFKNAVAYSCKYHHNILVKTINISSEISLKSRFFPFVSY